MKHFLVIKGSQGEAKAACVARKIDFEPVYDNGLECQGYTSAPINRVIDWFCEEVDSPPYPAGTLLWYREALSSSSALSSGSK